MLTDRGLWNGDRVQCVSLERVYYIAAVDVEWDYAPTGLNAMNGISLDNDPDASVFTKKSIVKDQERIGKVYKKTVYREYTNATFSEQKPQDKHLGILGPVIKGEMGDLITVYFKNMAKRNFSVHPHGVFYKKSSEGAMYVDNTSGRDKMDDDVMPGTTYKYEWAVKEENSPRPGDDACIPWLYHSHIQPVHDINTGTVGILLTCKKGSLDAHGNRKDVNKEFYVLASVFDENKSWYLDDNLIQNNIQPLSVNKEDDGFKESNLMHAMNGIFYGNLQGLDVCLGDKVVWYVANLGNEVDMHITTFHGNTLISDHHRTDELSVFPARSVVATMEVTNPGVWMFSCQVADHFSGGMFTTYNAKKCSKNPRNDDKFNTLREYFIAAEEIEWDYGPSGRNNFDGGYLANGSSSGTFFKRSSNRIGGKYVKAVYVEYTDSTFSTKKNRSADQMHLGFIGPVIRAEVSDKIRVHFKNKASRPYSMHPRGVIYNKMNEGALYNDNTKGNASKLDDSVQPNATYVYNWTVPKSVAPTALDWPCIVWIYSSNTDQVKDMYSGLVGPLVICKNGSLQSNGLPQGYDEQRFLFLGVTDENKSWYLDKNMNTYCTSSNCAGISKEDEDFMESNKMHQINGYMYGNLKGLEFCKGQKILWHTFVVGTEVDMHSMYFHGNTFKTSDDNHKDSLTLFPGQARTFEMIADNPGNWALVCRINDHFSAGMKAMYAVNNCSKANTPMSTTVHRRFHIGIVEIEWDYAESNRSLLHDFDLDTYDSSKVFTKRGPKRIGKVYKKAVYREFTDGTFTKQKQRSVDMKHLGVLGPIIRAEEGDEIVVVLKNMASRSYSISPHGAIYSKQDEGSAYMDGNGKLTGKQVAPGKTATYNWFVPAKSSPGIKDGPCVTWAYYSAVDTVKDTNSGLIGPLITCKKGTLNSKGMRNDVEKEFALLFTVMDENESWYLDANIQKYALNPTTVSKSDDGFKESNKMHGINGYIYGNGPRNGNFLVMNTNSKIAWYLIGVGNEVDIHTVHFHANNFVHKTNSEHNHDVYNIFPGVYETLEMTPKNPGTWLLHCHVHDHLEAGMETRYTVLNAGPTTKGPVTPKGSASRLKPAIFAILSSIVFMLTLYLH
eukprot:gene14203-15685_t